MISNQTWERIPFQAVSGTLTKDKTKTHLPFNIGAISKHGITHNNIGINNQDAVHLVIEDNFIIGVLCDGATNNHPNVVNSYSTNATGASLMTHMIANLCRENITPRKNKMNREKFLLWMSEQVISRTKRLEQTLRVPEEYSKEFRHNLLTTTINAFIVRDNEYFTFHFGDGFVASNGKIIELEDDYISRFNTSPEIGIFKETSYGLTKDLISLALFSDGFKSKIIASNSMQNLFKTRLNQNGYSDLIPEFHLKTLANLDEDLIHFWPKDDATMILLRKSK